MYQSDVEGAKALVQKYEQLKREISKVIVGQNEIIHNTILSVFCQGHVLLVGVPGLAKTLFVLLVKIWMCRWDRDVVLQQVLL